MQVEEVSAEGLRRAYRVVIPAAEIENRVQTRLKRLSQTVRMPGFRPGKAPITLLRKQYGRSVMGEILEQAVDEGSRKAIEHAIEFFGEDHVLFASDAPFDPEGGPMYIRETIRILDSLDVSDEVRRKLYQDNAVKLLGLKL